MAITTYAGVIPSMQTRIPDCSTLMIQQALWEAGREFFVESESYIQELTAIDSVADQKTYTLTIPSQFDPIRAFEVRRLTADDVSNGEKGTVINPSEYDFHLETNILEFRVTPFQEVITGGLVVELVLAPQEDEDDTQLDFDFVRRWMRYIKAGAFSRLFGMEESVWFSDRKSAENYDTFRTGIAYARRWVKLQGTTRQLRIRGGAFL